MSFSVDTLSFLQHLANNNTKEWFAEHRDEYEITVKKPSQWYFKLMCARLEEFLQTKVTGKIFRINRDMRFARETTPYNTYIRMLFTRVGTESLFNPSLYLSIESDKIIVGAGTMEFESQALQPYRSLVVGEQGAYLHRMVDGYVSRGCRLGEAALKRVPSGYNCPADRAYLLKHKGLALWKELPADEELILSVEPVLRAFVTFYTFYDFLDSYRDDE